jgi:protein TonB
MPARRPARYDVLPGGAPARGWRTGVAASIALHVALVLLLLIPLRHDFARVLDQGRSEAGTRGGGGGGGGRVAYISLPAPQASPRVAVEVVPPSTTPPPVVVTPPVVPPPVIPPPAAEPTPPAPTQVAAAAGPDSIEGSGPGQGGGTGGGQGGGVGPGMGPGTGPGTGGGAGGQGRAPQPRHLIIPPDDPPKELRGVEIRVTFWIDPLGSVKRVAFDPPVDNRKFAGKLSEAMKNYRFRPALGPDGTPIAATYTHTLLY